MECYTPATTLQHAPRTAELAEFPISIATVLATLRAFDAGKMLISWNQKLFYAGII